MLLLLVALVAGTAVPASRAWAAVNETELVSRASGATGDKSDGYSSSPVLSASGRYVAFTSSAKNLTSDGPGMYDFTQDVYLRDTLTNATTLVSRASGSAGVRGSGSSGDPAISGDGRHVAFVSDAQNLSADDTDFKQDVFIRDTSDGTTTLVSRASGVAGAKGDDDSVGVAISPNGRFVAFATLAGNLSADDGGFRTQDVYVRDLEDNTTTLVSRASGTGGVRGDAASYASSVTDDGRYVGFSSQAGNLAPDDGDHYFDAFVRDTQAHTTTLVSRANGAEARKGNYDSFGSRLSADGRYAAFSSEAGNLTADDPSYDSDVFVRDLREGTTTLVSDPRRFSDDKGDSGRFALSMSEDGRFVLFSSESRDLVPDDADDQSDLLVRDVQTGELELVSRASGPTGAKGNRGSYGGAISADGLRVGFQSGSTNLTPDDPDDKTDVFVRERAAGGPDRTAPETTVDLGPGKPNDDRPRSDTTPTFSFHSSEPGSRLECRVDDAPFATCASPYTTPALADGSYTFDVRATDRAGNPDATPARRDFTVDTVPPDTTITSGPVGTTADNTPRFHFSSSEGGPGPFGDCRVDGGEWKRCGEPFDIRASLPDGAHYVEIRAQDAAENVDPTPARRDFVVRAAPLETTIDSGPSGPTTDREPHFSFSTPHPDQLFQCRFDDEYFRQCESPHYVGSFSDGPHAFEVRAADSASNVDPTPARREFTVDTQAPETTIDSGPGGVATDRATFGFSSSEPDSAFECRIDDLPFRGCSSPHTTGALAAGSHNFEVRATDPAANTDSTPASRAFVVGPGGSQTGAGSGGSTPGTTLRPGPDPALAPSVARHPKLAEMRAALGSDLKASARALRRLGIAKLLRRGGLTARGLDPLVAGRFSATLTGRRRGPGVARSVLLARGSRPVFKARPVGLELLVTRTGRRLLSRDRRATLTLTIRFRDEVGRTVGGHRSVVVSR